MKYFLSLFTLIALFSSSVVAQGDKVLLEIEDEKITVDEFMRVYKKNNQQEKSMDKKSIEDYLDLFINFQLKVKQAEDMQLDTMKDFREELEGYREQLARPYLIDKEVQEKMMREAYDRMQYDVRASHVLVKVNPDAPPEDTAKAYQKAMDIKKRIQNGEPIEKVAMEESEDQSARKSQRGGRTIPGNKGDLGYFTVFDMVYPFENAVYNMKQGEVSDPVRTRFGYHVIQLKDKIPAIGEAKVAHIMIPNNKMDSAAAQQKLDSVKQEIEKGNLSFEEAVKKFSGDTRTKNKGGVLPEFTSNNMVPAFIKEVSKLKQKGDISAPVQTMYGNHLIKLVYKKEPGSWEEERSEIKSKIKKSERGDKAEKISAANIRKEYGYNISQKVKDKLLAHVDSSILTENWEVNMDDIPETTLFKIDDKKYPATDFAKYLLKNQKQNGKGDPQLYAKDVFQKYIDERTMEYKKSMLEKEHPKFHTLMKEYRDGILLFNLMTEKVWSKAMEDTTGLKEYFEKNKEDYMWGERLHATIFKSPNKDAAEMARKLVKQNIPSKTVADSVNAVDEYQMSVNTKRFSKGENETINELKWNEGLTDIMEKNNEFIFVNKHEKLEPGPKKLEEVRGLVIADYQNYLEEQWIKELRSKYDFEVNKKVLNKIK
ncbi:MAG: peptidylprolyl isomerase [Bacteroidota bacterium]